LLTESEIFKDEILSGAESADNPSEEKPERHDHAKNLIEMLFFTDDLNRARRQFVTSFEAKSINLAPTATGTDIFGGLWHVKAIVDSAPSSRGGSTKNIYIFSDMMNETAEFPMPRLLEIGPENMLERAKTTSLLVPLHGYSIYIYGASTNGLTAHSWETVRRFWELYFAAAGATLVTYSTQCEIGR
jgi:hypothetical protein